MKRAGYSEKFEVLLTKIRRADTGAQGDLKNAYSGISED